MAGKKKFQAKTFTDELKIFEARRELAARDDQANRFIKEKQVISVSDATTTDNTGASIGLIRVFLYEA